MFDIRTPVKVVAKDSQNPTTSGFTPEATSPSSQKRQSPEKAQSVRRSIGEWESGKPDLNPKLLTPPKKAASVEPQKPKKALSQGSRVVAKVSTEASGSPPLQLKIKYTDRLVEARACVTKAKLNLANSRNIKTEIKTEVTQAVDRLYQLVKESESVKGQGKRTPERKHESEREKVPEKEIGKEESELIRRIEEHTRLIKENSERMERLKEVMEMQTYASVTATKKDLEDAETRLSAQITYAQAARTAPIPAPAQRKTMHSIIVSSRDVKDTSDTVMEKIKTAVKARETGVRVERVRKGRNQAVVITCREKEEMEKVVNRLNNKKVDLKIEEAKNKNPMVVIRDVMQYLTDDDLTTAIVKQNTEILKGIKIEKEDMKVKFKRRARNPLTVHVVLQVTPTIWQRLTAAGRLHVDLQRVVVQDQSPLIQCTKCLGYGHGRKFCKETEGDLCSHCGGPHLRRECEAFLLNEAPDCRNCKQAKKDRTDHNAFDRTCSVRRKWEELARSAVAYC